MFRLISRMIKTPNPVTRGAPLGLPVNMVNVRLTLTRRTPSVQVSLFASFSANKHQHDNMLAPRIERKLGDYEEYLLELGREKGWGVVCGCVAFRSETELSPEQIRKAIGSLQRRHAALRMAVILKDGKRYFAEVSDAPNFEVLQATDRKAVIAKEEHELFTFGQLLWRLRLLKPETTDQGYIYRFIFSHHACLFDGPTLFANLYPDLVNMLNSSIAEDWDDSTESLPILPAREQLLDQYQDVYSDGDEFPPNDWNSNKAIALKLINMNKPSNPHPGSGLVDFVLDKEQTTQLLQLVVQHDVSVNSVCTAAHALALYRLLIDLGLLTDQGWSLQSPFVVDLRIYARPKLPLSQSGVYVGELSNNLIIPANAASSNDKEVLLKLASSTKKEIWKLLANPKANLASMKFFKSGYYKMLLEDSEALYRECDPVLDLFYISTLGKHTFPRGKGKVTFDKLELLTGTREPLLFCHSIHRLNSSRLLHWQLSYSKMLVSDELAETYISLIKEELTGVL